MTFSLISSTVEKSTFLSSSAALLTRRPSVVPINDMLDSYWMFEKFQSWNLKCTFYICLDYINYHTLIIRGWCMVLWCMMMNCSRNCWGISTFSPLLWYNICLLRDTKNKIRYYMRWYCKMLLWYSCLDIMSCLPLVTFRRNITVIVEMAYVPCYPIHFRIFLAHSLISTRILVCCNMRILDAIRP